MGCFADKEDNRALPWLLSSEPTISIDICYGLAIQGSKFDDVAVPAGRLKVTPFWESLVEPQPASSCLQLP
jgi:hypothetical protein